MAVKVVPQREIADMLAKAGIADVEQRTVFHWLSNFDSGIKIAKPDDTKSDKLKFEVPDVTAEQIDTIWETIITEPGKI